MAPLNASTAVDATRNPASAACITLLGMQLMLGFAQGVAAAENYVNFATAMSMAPLSSQFTPFKSSYPLKDAANPVLECLILTMRWCHLG